MPYQDFRQFLDVLRQQGELVDIEVVPVVPSTVTQAVVKPYLS